MVVKIKLKIYKKFLVFVAGKNSSCMQKMFAKRVKFTRLPILRLDQPSPVLFQKLPFELI